MTETAESKTAESKSAPLTRRRDVRIGAVLAVALAAGFLAWLIVDHSSSSPSAKKTNAKAVSAAELKKLPAKVGHPVYWAGPAANDTYELTQTRNGSIYIRYLPKGTQIGDPKPNYTTIGTYPSATAYATLQAGSHRKDATVFNFQSGAIAVTYSKTPSSVFFAFPNSPYIVEAFDPSPARAQQLVRSGQVQLIR